MACFYNTYTRFSSTFLISNPPNSHLNFVCKNKHCYGCEYLKQFSLLNHLPERAEPNFEQGHKRSSKIERLKFKLLTANKSIFKTF